MTAPSTQLSVPTVGDSGDHWWAQGREIAKRHQATEWELGDWWRGPGRPNDVTVDDVAGELGLKPDAIWRSAWLSGVFPPERRRPCSRSHHCEVAALPGATADRLLDRAVDEKWTVARIRKAAQDARQKAESGRDTQAAEQLVLDLRPTLDAWRSSMGWVEKECRGQLAKAEAALQRIIDIVGTMAKHPGAGAVHGNRRMAAVERLRGALAPADTSIDLSPKIWPLLDRIWRDPAAARAQELK